MLPTILVEELQQVLQKHTSNRVIIQQASAVSGGSINNSFLVHTSAGKFFLKHNSAQKYPGMFVKEARALEMVAQTQTVPVPSVITHGEAGEEAFILMEYLQAAPRSNNFWQQFGANLAAMHRNTQSTYGLDEDNYMGSLPQRNTPKGNWVNFFVENRLIPQVMLARENGLLSDKDVQQFENLYTKLDDLLPTEQPALIHGDLWSGNFMSGPQGRVYIFDPALYYGHREAELAMTTLFGGFDAAFYDAYYEAWPLLPGWRNRLDLYNLYPLLIHLNLFGSGYLASVRGGLKGYCE